MNSVPILAGSQTVSTRGTEQAGSAPITRSKRAGQALVPASSTGMAHGAAARRPSSVGEEQEFIRLNASHYQALLKLGHLTSSQRSHIMGLLAECEAIPTNRIDHFATGCGGRREPQGFNDPSRSVDSRSREPIRRTLHENVECLTAIRLYALGVRKALSNGKADVAASALTKIDAQVVRAYELISAARRASDAREAHLLTGDDGLCNETAANKPSYDPDQLLADAAKLRELAARADRARENYLRQAEKYEMAVKLSVHTPPIEAWSVLAGGD